MGKIPTISFHVKSFCMKWIQRMDKGKNCEMNFHYVLALKKHTDLGWEFQVLLQFKIFEVKHQERWVKKFWILFYFFILEIKFSIWFKWLHIQEGSISRPFRIWDLFESSRSKGFKNSKGFANRPFSYIKQHHDNNIAKGECCTDRDSEERYVSQNYFGNWRVPFELWKIIFL